MKSQIDRKTRDYYNDCQFLYNLFWSKYALHYGFWEDGTKKLSDAMDNTNKFVAEKLELDSDDLVLDVGCGVGGSAIFLAKQYGVKVIGIGLSEKQIDQAISYSKDMELQDYLDFRIMDFNKTSFSDNTFSKIFAIESVCHSLDKPSFLKEAYRIMRPGGRIVIVDGFLTKRNLNQDENDIYEKCLSGWKVIGLSHKHDFAEYMKDACFKNIKFFDKTKEVIPSSKRISIYGYVFYPFSFVLSRTGLGSKNLHENTICMINQRKTFNNFTKYGVYVAEK